MESSLPSSLTTAGPGYHNTPEEQDSDLKSHFMKMIEAFKENRSNSLKNREKYNQAVEGTEKKWSKT